MSRKTELQRQILIIAYDNPNLSKAEIARKLDCSSSYVSQVLNRYDGHDAMQARIEELNSQLGMDTASSNMGLGTPTPTGGSSTGPIESDIELTEEGIEEVGPIGALVLALVVGGFLLFSNPLTDSMNTVRWGIIAVCALVAVAVVALTYRAYQKDGVRGATSWLIGDGDEGETKAPSNQSNEKTPPAPESLKNELIFERADLDCEWCGDHVDQPEVHHIQPRSEGGPNTQANLAVLCPNCHRKADRGGISRSKLKAKIRRQIE